MLYKKDNSKYWYTKFELSFGGKLNKVNRSTRETSKIKALAFEQNLRIEIWDKLTLEEKNIGSWKEAAFLYLDSRQSNKTIASKQNKLDWWEKCLPSIILSSIDAQSIMLTIAKRTDIGLATKNRYLAEIKSFLSFVHKELGWIEKTPHIKIYKEYERSFYKLSDNDVDSLIKHSPLFLKPIIIFALNTGLRASNITQLRWDMVDLSTRTLSIHGTQHKSGASIRQPFNRVVELLLLKLHESKSNQYVFLNANQSPIKDLNRRLWGKVCDKSGLKGLRFHDLRHNWASRHAESGTDVLAIKELGGWKTLEMVQRYTHPSMEYLSVQSNNIIKQDAVPNDEEITVCDEKSSHLVVLDKISIVKDKAQKWKNLISFNNLSGLKCGAQTRDRTKDTRIFNPLLYQLSYLGFNLQVFVLKTYSCFVVGAY